MKTTYHQPRKNSSKVHTMIINGTKYPRMDLSKLMKTAFRRTILLPAQADHITSIFERLSSTNFSRSILEDFVSNNNKTLSVAFFAQTQFGRPYFARPLILSENTSPSFPTTSNQNICQKFFPTTLQYLKKLYEITSIFIIFFEVLENGEKI